MAKALLGHVAAHSYDPRLVAELRRLQLRVKELEAELADVRAESVAGDLLTITEREPALT